MLKKILKSLLILILPIFMAVDLRGANPAINDNSTTGPGSGNNKGDPVDLSTGENLVWEEGLRLATPGIPLSFDLA